MRQKRKRDVIQYATEQKVPLSELQPRIPAAHLLHLPQCHRDVVRNSPSVRAASERTVRKLMMELANTHGTTTRTLQDPNLDAAGAYVTDPLKLTRILVRSSTFLAVGGDSGGDSPSTLKLGITYTSPSPPIRPRRSRKTPMNAEVFIPLIVLAGTDDWGALAQLRDGGYTQFEGETAAAGCQTIWQVLQHILSGAIHSNVFLNGDWKFLNCVLGLKSAASNNPCPICKVHRSQLLTLDPHRTPENNPSVGHHRFLWIDPQRIVPLPLHVFLGIANRIITMIFPKLIGLDRVQLEMAEVSSVHSRGCGGQADRSSLNGSELSKWLSGLHTWELFMMDEEDDEMMPPDDISRMARMDKWMRELQHSLLNKDRWTSDALEAFQELVISITSDWTHITGDRIFPKLHMLLHCVEFAIRHRFLGRYSESQLESCHARMNQLFHHNHRNMGSKLSERVRRTLVGVLLKAMQPCLICDADADPA